MVGVRAAGVRRWLREALADRARRMVLVLVLLLWLAVAVSGTVGPSQWSEHISALEFEARYGKVYRGEHLRLVEWPPFTLSPRSDRVPAPSEVWCP